MLLPRITSYVLGFQKNTPQDSEIITKREYMNAHKISDG